jgi:uncharacterized protein (UPF0332 family)
MSDINALFSYRREQALSTLQEAEKMVNGGFTPRTIINRSYYAMFYMVLALFLKKGIGISTSKHTGIIGTFDKQFILTDTLDRTYSKMLHKMFDKRLEPKLRDFVCAICCHPHCSCVPENHEPTNKVDP